MNSIAYRQQQVINSKAVDLNSSSSSDFKPYSGDALQIALYNVAAKFINSAQQNLENVDRISSGALEGSIQPTDIIVMGKIMTININVLDYYRFIDQGVKGWQSGEPSGSPYEFKAPSGKKGSAPKNSKMVTAIRKWLIKEGLKNTANLHQTQRGLSATAISRQARRASITDTATSTAIKISGIIRKRGLKKTKFWSDSFATTNAFAVKEFETALKIDIINSL